MAWTDPVAVTIGELLTAAKYNTQIKDDLIFLHETHGPIWIPGVLLGDGGTLGGTERGTEPATYEGSGFLDGISNTYKHAVTIVPDDWISGGLTAKIHWAANDATAGNIFWQFHYIFRTTGSNLLAARTLLTVVSAAPGVADQSVVANAGVTSAPTAGDLMLITLQRDAGHASDTYTGTAFVVGLELEYI